MVSFMQFYKNAISIFFAIFLIGCSNSTTSQRSGSLQIHSAIVEQHNDNAWLIIALRWNPSAAMLEALNQGIPLTLQLTLQAEEETKMGWYYRVGTSEHHLELHYYPLSRQYQLREIESNNVRNFSGSAYLFSNLEELRFRLDSDIPTQQQSLRYILSVTLDTATLPGALRLPALIDPDWNINKSYIWNL